MLTPNLVDIILIAYGHDRVWPQFVLGHEYTWAQSCMGTIMYGHNRVHAQSYLDTTMYRHNRIWKQSCVAQSCIIATHPTKFTSISWYEMSVY